MTPDGSTNLSTNPNHGHLPSRRQALGLGVASLATTACATPTTPAAGPAAAAPDLALRRAQVRQAEQAFSDAMAARNLDAFAALVADDAVFINGGKPLRGKAAILAVWRGFFLGPTAPFTWRPEVVEVAANGELGYSEGPVTARDGTSTLRYFSTWALQADGRWRVVFDNGTTVCKG